MPSQRPPAPGDTTAPAVTAWGRGLTLEHAIPAVWLYWTDADGSHEKTITSPTTLGSAPDAPIRVADPTISRLHLALTPVADGVLIEDLDSRNGTYYANARVGRICLRDGARFTAGSTEFALQHRAAGAQAKLFPMQQYCGMSGRSEVMRELFLRIGILAGRPETVLIHGETGTGKELVARALHDQSARKGKPFIVVDCGALTESLLGSELFGHVRGAFTGASHSRAGAFQAANGGTLFLDEVGELPLSLQPHLLRAIESRTVRSVGTSEYEPIDVRFVCATHRDLRAMVNAGTFREDLYFRLAVLQIEVPPLRERPEDILLLLQRFLTAANAQAPIEPEHERAALARRWTGNVRELRNFADRVAALGWRAALDTDDPRPTTAPAPSAPVPAGTPPADLLQGNYCAARDAAHAWWEDAYLAALRKRHGNDLKALLAEAEITRSYLSKLSRR